jgi:membrane protease YdiL (CAAX protease family)
MRVPVFLRAVVTGVVIALVPANVWPRILFTLGVRWGSVVEIGFLALFVWWASGGGPPRNTQAVRKWYFRHASGSPSQWPWGIVAALAFAITVHAAIVLLFRLVPFPAAAFREGYDLSFISSRRWQWLAVVISATSAGICEETGFRGYLQRPLEDRYGAPRAILVSSLAFMVLHLTKAWALVGMTPIVLGAGGLLGLLAWSSGSLIFSIVGHIVMDIGLFGYWWSGIAGDFTAQPISETGVDPLFIIALVGFSVALLVALVAMRRLRQGANRSTPSGALTLKVGQQSL